ncbi:MAG: penicillin-binding protein, partial [Candidatus Hydrothermota bacterium]
GIAPYFLDMVRKYVIQRYGEDFLYTSGGKIYTTLDLELQKIAEAAVDSFLDLYEEEYDLEPKKADYVRDTLNPPQYLQGALVAMDPYTGEIRALVGGRDYDDSKFNRVTQMRRQPGSAFKPFVYTAAIDNGYNPSDILMDVPLALRIPGVEELWYPENYDGRYLGPITLRRALALSRNLATAHLILELGPSVVAEYARKMGIESPVPPYPSIALGSPTLSLLEITRAYAPIANLGSRVDPYFVSRIEDPEGRVLEENFPKVVQVLDSSTAYIMIDMLKSVIERRVRAGSPG